MVVGRGARALKGVNTPTAIVLSVVDGKPGRLVDLPRFSDTVLEAVSCASARLCVAVGTRASDVANGSAGHAVYLSVAGSVAGPVRAVPGHTLLLDGISCAATRCEAVGSDGTAVVVTLTLS